MKRMLITALYILIGVNAYAGTMGGFIVGRASKSCKSQCQNQYQQGYQAGIKACEHKAKDEQ